MGRRPSGRLQRDKLLEFNQAGRTLGTFSFPAAVRWAQFTIQIRAFPNKLFFLPREHIQLPFL